MHIIRDIIIPIWVPLCSYLAAGCVIFGIREVVILLYKAERHIRTELISWHWRQIRTLQPDDRAVMDTPKIQAALDRHQRAISSHNRQLNQL